MAPEATDPHITEWYILRARVRAQRWCGAGVGVRVGERRGHSGKGPFIFERMGSVDEEQVQMNIEVQSRAEALDEGHGSGTDIGAHAQSERPDSGRARPCRGHLRGPRRNVCHA